MFARRAAAEIIARHDDLRGAISWLVEHEIRVFRAVLIETHFRKQARAQTGARNGLQVLLGDNHVRVDVHDVERRGDAGERGELVHEGPSETPDRTIGACLHDPGAPCQHLLRRDRAKAALMRDDNRNDKRLATFTP